MVIDSAGVADVDASSSSSLLCSPAFDCELVTALVISDALRLPPRPYPDKKANYLTGCLDSGGLTGVLLSGRGEEKAWT